jgi:hypothetical protein
MVRGAKAAPPAGTEFDKFLYASIGEETNGTLSVLSALARLDLDPWDEASRLARMPRRGAIQFLTTLITALPDGSSARSNPTMHAERLTALLPLAVESATAPVSAPTLATEMTTNHQGLVRYALFYLVLAMLFFGAQWLIEHSHQPAHPGPVTSPQTGEALPHTPVN